MLFQGEVRQERFNLHKAVNRTDGAETFQGEMSQERFNFPLAHLQQVAQPRGHIQLPGSGERVVAPLGSWKGRELSPQEKKCLLDCACPACQRASIAPPQSARGAWLSQPRNP